MSKPKPGTKKMFERRMRPAKSQRVSKEFDAWIHDLAYDSLLESPDMKAFLFEAFVGGWGAKTRAIKRREKKGA